MFKKLLMLAIVVLLVVTVMVGCGLGAMDAEDAQDDPKEDVADNDNATETDDDKKEPAEDAIVIKISNGINDKHPAYIGQKKFEEIVEEQTDGRYDIQVYHSAQLGDDIKATQDVRMGNLEMVCTSSSPLTGMSKELMVFDLPFLFASEEIADKVLDGPIGDKIGKTLEDKNLVNLAYFENGFRQLTNSKREVKTPDDVKGLKIRTMENPIHLAAWKAIGANPTPMPFSEVFTAMQQETIDGQENPIPTIYLQKFYEVQDYTSLTKHVYTPFLVLINKDLWESFSEEDQEIFINAVNEARDLERELNRQMNSDLVDELRNEGMTVTELSAEQIKAFQEKCAPVYDKFADQIGKELVDEVLEATK